MGWLMRVLPLTTVAVAAVMPLAAGLYLLTTTTWAAAERTIIARRIPRSRGPGSGRRDVRAQ